MKIINNSKQTVQVCGLEIKPKESATVANEVWQAEYLSRKPLRDAVAHCEVSAVEEVEKKIKKSDKE